MNSDNASLTTTPQVTESSSSSKLIPASSRRQQELAVKRARLYESRKLVRQARRVKRKFTHSLENSAQAFSQGSIIYSSLQVQNSTDSTNNSTIPLTSTPSELHTAPPNEPTKNVMPSVETSSTLQPVPSAATASLQVVLGQLRPRPMRAALRANSIARSACGIRVAIDLSLDSYMSEHEINKLGNQLGQIYAFNRRLAAPVQLYFTGVRPQSQIGARYERFPEMRAWDLHWHAEDYFELFSKSTSSSTSCTSSPLPDTSKPANSGSNSNLNGVEALASTSAPRMSCKLCANSSSLNATSTPPTSIVYLTGDSDNLLTSIEPNTLFVFGGLVDHNRQRGLTHRLATERGLRLFLKFVILNKNKFIQILRVQMFTFEQK